MRIGTRGSALALAQAGWVAKRLGPGTEIVTVLTSGDRSAANSDKSRWVTELEQAVLAGEIDVAVHSAKDVPADLPAGLELAAIPARADARDALCGAESLDALAPGARVGSSSLRRKAQIRAQRQDVEVVDVRGNVDTRLRRLAEGDYDALVLALAGLQRLGRGHEASCTLDQLVPAAGQGALAVQARSGDRAVAARLAGIVDDEASACVGAERELVRALGATCNTPVGAHARLLEGGRLELRAWVGDPDGSAWLADRVVAQAGAFEAIGLALAKRMRAAGAEELLQAAERAR